MNGLNNFRKTDKEYTLAPNDDLIRFWGSKVKVTPWLKYGVESIHVIAGALKSNFWLI